MTATTGAPPSWASPATSGTVTSVSGTANQVAVATGTTTPVISLIGPYTPATYLAHGVLIGEGTSSIATTAVGTTGQILTGVTGADPVWASPATSGTVTSVSGTANQVSVATGTTTPVISLVGPYTPSTYTSQGILFGQGTSSILATTSVNNAVLITSATGLPSLLADGTTGQVLTATTGSPPSWASPATSGTVTSVSGTANQVSVATGTTTPVISLIGPYTPSTYLAHGVLLGEGTSSIVATAVGTTGQVLMGVTGADPTWSTATYPATAGTTGNVLTSDGTNFVSSSAPGGGLLTVTGTLTSAQIKALHGTPIQIIAAPASGSYIEVIHAVLKYNYAGSNVFIASAAQTISLYYGTTTPLAVTDSSGINAPIQITNASLVGSASVITMSSSLIPNVVESRINAKQLSFYNNSVTEITGNAANDNTVTYSIIYKIVTI